ncbi:unnamed protein product [Paramecium primaurelia]|uniref:Uncharacterized protein n=1 Tax=Paramecium primaurelia TaxID=5886 RepID=A0A8S1PNT4_PARPR|nr:unnamed protein product [Paramecium primaurelia]
MRDLVNQQKKFIRELFLTFLIFYCPNQWIILQNVF